MVMVALYSHRKNDQDSVCICLCTTCVQVPAEYGRSARTLFTGSSELTDVGTGN